MANKQNIAFTVEESGKRKEEEIEKVEREGERREGERKKGERQKEEERKESEEKRRDKESSLPQHIPVRRDLVHT